MKLKRAEMRVFGAQTLESRGFTIEEVRKPGVAPGARLKISNALGEHLVTVRTARSRKIGLLRTESGKWRTIPDVDEVVVVVPADPSGKSVEILGFDPGDIVTAFDEAALHQKGLPGSPVFVFLDQLESKAGRMASGLSKKAKWREVIKLDAALIESLKERNVSESLFKKLERIKREFAKFNGLDESKVQIDIRVIV
jgi:hypothetical protein